MNTVNTSYHSTMCATQIGTHSTNHIATCTNTYVAWHATSKRIHVPYNTQSCTRRLQDVYLSLQSLYLCINIPWKAIERPLIAKPALESSKTQSLHQNSLEPRMLCLLPAKLAFAVSNAASLQHRHFLSASC